MKKKKPKKSYRPRRLWDRNPVTKIKQSDKRYKRKDNKKEINKELERGE